MTQGRGVSWKQQDNYYTIQILAGGGRAGLGWAGLGWAGQDAPTVITSTSQTGVETRASNQQSLSKFKVV